MGRCILRVNDDQSVTVLGTRLGGSKEKFEQQDHNKYRLVLLESATAFARNVHPLEKN
jgi:hypothetical protein